MAKQDAAALREARQARVASRNKGTKSKVTKTAAPVASEEVAPVATAPFVITAAVLDINSIPTTAQVDLVGYSQTEDPFWVVLANGRPVGEIRLSDQEAGTSASMFTEDDYGSYVREAAAQVGLPDVLTGLKARLYQASVSSDDAYKAIEDKLTKEASATLREARSAVRDDMSNMLNLVVLAQNKNFLSETPLKNEFFRRMAEAGIDERRAVAIIEGAFQTGATAHFDVCFKQAEKWMDLTPQALGELEEQIKGLGYRQPVVAESDDVRAASVAPTHFNVPFQTRTAGSHSEPEGKEALRRSMNLRGKR